MMEFYLKQINPAPYPLIGRFVNWCFFTASLTEAFYIRSCPQLSYRVAFPFKTVPMQLQLHPLGER